MEQIRIKICNLDTVPDKWVWQLKVGNVHHATSAINYDNRRNAEAVVLKLFGDGCALEAENGTIYTFYRDWEA